ncbi:hypothetical protein BaRGS_00015953, partial [Batillaria attramentaria]
SVGCTRTNNKSSTAGFQVSLSFCRVFVNAAHLAGALSEESRGDKQGSRLKPVQLLETGSGVASLLAVAVETTAVILQDAVLGTSE